jgi:hypothetical protein
VAARRGSVVAGHDASRGGVALPGERPSDPQAHPAGLRRARHVLARRALRNAGRGERRGVQRAGREDPRQEQAAEGTPHDLFSPHPDDDVISMGGILRSSSRTRTRCWWRT